MESLILHDLRCFHSLVDAPLAPLTLLVGENSTGKSTFLAAVRLAWDIANGNRQPDFNEEPFQLGAYDQVANVRVGRGEGRAENFKVGFACSISHETSKHGDRPAETKHKAEVVATFRQVGAQPIVTELAIDSKPYEIKIKYPASNGESARPMKLELSAPSGRFSAELKVQFREASGIELSILHFLFNSQFGERQRILPFEEEPTDQSGAKPTKHELDAFSAIVSSVMRQLSSRPYAMAPIRTEPKRTYHPTKEMLRAAGAHVPMELAEMAGSDERAWTKLRERLDEFGKDSGLFKWLNVRRLGKKLSDPFQLEVKVSGKSFNLVDVGYGVSQALPLLVDSLLSDHKIFLMQQPEVHLHPRAQAELGTLLGLLVKKERKRFVVETHSDYIIDRVRLDVRENKTLSPKDVVILYFERTGQDVSVYPLRIDEGGNIEGAPATYRDFFLAEERRFFGAS